MGNLFDGSGELLQGHTIVFSQCSQLIAIPCSQLLVPELVLIYPYNLLICSLCKDSM
jgi:hypothetical protein